MASLLAQAVGGSRRVTAEELARWRAALRGSGQKLAATTGDDAGRAATSEWGGSWRRGTGILGRLAGFQVGIADGPIRVGVAGFDATPEHLQCVCLHGKGAVGARGVVEHIGIGGTHGHGNAHMQHRVFGLTERREVRSQQDACADIVGKLL